MDFAQPFAMPFAPGLGAAVGGVIAYRQRDEFTTALAAGSVNNTAAEPGAGTRHVTDTESKLSIASGKLDFASGKASPAYGDPGYWLDGETRTIGRMFACELNASVLATKVLIVGWDNNQAGDILGYGFVVTGTVNVKINDGTSITVTVGGALSTSTSYKLLFALNSTGCQCFIQGGAYTYPTLLWLARVGTTTPLYPAIVNNSATFTSEFARVPENVLWLARPYASDGFGGTFGTTDGAGHTDSGDALGSGGSGVAWTQVGTWGNSAGKAAASALDGGLALATVPTATKDVWISAALTRAGDNVGLVGRYADANNYLIAYHDGTNAKLDQVLAGVTSTLITGAAAFSANAIMRLEMDGSNAALYYNDARIGTSSSINAGLTATAHGLYTTNTGNTFDGFNVFARGTANEYSRLTDFF